MALDLPTLLIALLCAFFLVAILTLLAALYPSRSPTLLWFFNAFLVAGIGYIIVALTGDFAQSLVTVWVETALAILAHGCLWAGTRVFSNKKVPWLGMSIGPLFWLVLCLSVDGVARVGSPWIVNTYSFWAVVYTLAAIWELLPSVREKSWMVMPMLVVLFLHVIYNTFRVLPLLDLKTILLLDQVEGLMFVLAGAFAGLVMVYTRTQLQYLHDALHDGLTGLFNRRALFQQIAWLQATKAQERNITSIAILMCDLDWFKQVNDSLGHAVGDRVLSVFADVLRDVTRNGDICSRLGGEEFVVVAQDVNAADSYRLAERIRQQLAVATQRLPVNQTVSIGIASFGDTSMSLESMLKCADKALYQAKAEGRDCVREWQKHQAQVQA